MEPFRYDPKRDEKILRAHGPRVATDGRSRFRPQYRVGDALSADRSYDRAFVVSCGIAVLPFRPHDKIDIVNVDSWQMRFRSCT